MKEYMEHSGDNSIAEEMFPLMLTTLKTHIDRMEDGLVPNFDGDPLLFNFYEWSDDIAVELFKGDEKRTEIQLNSILSIALQSFEIICKNLKRPFAYQGLWQNLNKRIEEFFYNPKTKRYHETNELANALPILCGAVTGERQKELCKILTDYDNGLAPTTLSMIGFKYDALLKVDESYKDFILKDIDKNYGYMLSKGATSFWETIKGESDFNNAASLCHGWSAMPVYYYHILSKK